MKLKCVLQDVLGDKNHKNVESNQLKEFNLKSILNEICKDPNVQEGWKDTLRKGLSGAAVAGGLMASPSQITHNQHPARNSEIKSYTTY